jgi:hypothetical protein
MMEGEVILDGAKVVLRWLSKSWNAIVAPDEARRKALLDNVEKAVGIANSLKGSGQRSIEWKMDLYRELGLSEEKIREVILPEIETNTDPLSVIRRLAAEGAIRRVSEESEEGKTPPALPEGNE